MNQFEAETRQFELLVNANHPWLAFWLGAIRSPPALVIAKVVRVVVVAVLCAAIGKPLLLLASLIAPHH